MTRKREKGCRESRIVLHTFPLCGPNNKSMGFLKTGASHCPRCRALLGVLVVLQVTLSVSVYIEREERQPSATFWQGNCARAGISSPFPQHGLLYPLVQQEYRSIRNSNLQQRVIENETELRERLHHHYYRRAGSKGPCPGYDCRDSNIESQGCARASEGS